MTTLPSIFVSHGSPMMALNPGATGPFLQSLGPAIDATFGRPKAILAISAHTTAREPVVLAGAQHHAVYDFGGFPDELYQIQYNPAGDPALAHSVHDQLQSAGFPVHLIDHAGLDHGIWSMLRFMYPDAGIPVVPLAWVPNLPPSQQFALGEALAGLRSQGVLVLGTGGITHNLRGFFGPQRPPVDMPEIPQCASYRQWMYDHAVQRNWDEAFQYRQLAPHARDMHPTDEHLLPWFVAAGAGGRDAVPARIHDLVIHGALGLDVYAFGESAQTLAQALRERQADTATA